MMVRGHSSRQLALEAGYHFANLMNPSSGLDGVALSHFGACLTELVFGQVIGFLLILLWVYTSNQLYTLAYCKFFNSRS